MDIKFIGLKNYDELENGEFERKSFIVEGYIKLNAPLESILKIKACINSEVDEYEYRIEENDLKFVCGNIEVFIEYLDKEKKMCMERFEFFFHEEIEIKKNKNEFTNNITNNNVNIITDTYVNKIVNYIVDDKKIYLSFFSTILIHII